MLSLNVKRSRDLMDPQMARNERFGNNLDWCRKELDYNICIYLKWKEAMIIKIFKRMTEVRETKTFP